MCKCIKDLVSLIFLRKILFSAPSKSLPFLTFSCLHIQYLPALPMNVLFICKSYKRKILLVKTL